MNKHMHTGKNGYATLLATLIVSAFAAGVSLMLITSGAGDARVAQAHESSYRTQAFADACVEEALLLIKEGDGYAGADTLLFDGGACEFAVVVGAGESTVEAEGTANDAVRRVRVVAQTQVVGGVSTTTAITSVDWQEGAEF